MYRTPAVALCFAGALGMWSVCVCRAQPGILHGSGFNRDASRESFVANPSRQVKAHVVFQRPRATPQEIAAVQTTGPVATPMEAGSSSSTRAVRRAYIIPRPHPTPQIVWGPTTSGPFFTGTAEVEPKGSWYQEPYLFDFMRSGSMSEDYNQKVAIGLGHHLEFDAQMPLIFNIERPSTAPSGTTVSQFGQGDTHLDFKYEFTTDANTYRFLARPALSMTTDIFLPTGNVSGLLPNLYGVNQFGNGDFQEGVSLIMRKRVKPFSCYGQFGELIEDPFNASQGYQYNNNTTVVVSGQPVHVIYGNLLYYSGDLEYVLNDRRGIGFLAEVDGQSQDLRNLLFGAATAPSYSYLSAAPEAEYTWPTRKRYDVTWGAGVNLPVETGDYPGMVTPMTTVTFSFNGPHGNRNSN